MPNLCNSSITFGLTDALSQEILWLDCSFFAISLRMTLGAAGKSNVSSSALFLLCKMGSVAQHCNIVPQNIPILHASPTLIPGCGSPQKQGQQCHSWIYTWGSGSTRDAALLTWPITAHEIQVSAKWWTWQKPQLSQLCAVIKNCFVVL